MPSPSSLSPARSLVVGLLVLGLASSAWFLVEGFRGEVPVQDDPAPTAPTAAEAAPRAARVGEAAHDPREALSGASPVGVAAPSESGSSPDAAPPRARLRGVVVDARRAPVRGAKVGRLEQQDLPAGLALGLPRALRESMRGEVSTDEAGRFELALPELGEFELIATHDLHPSARAKGRADGPLVEGLVLELRDGGSIAGRVVGAPADAGALSVVAEEIEADLVDGAAAAVGAALIDLGGIVESLELPIGGRIARVAADGGFRLLGLEAGARYRVHAFRGGSERDVVARCTDRVDVREGAAGVELRWRPTLTLVLTVQDAATGAPLEELDVACGPVRKVEVLGMSIPAPMRRPVAQRRFANGIVVIDGLGIEDGKDPQLSIEVRAKGHRTWTRDDLVASSPGRMDLGVVRLDAAPIVRVRVRSGEEALAGVELELEPVESDDEAPRGATVSHSVRFSGDANAPSAIDAATPGHATTDRQGIAELTADFEGNARLVLRSPLHAIAIDGPFALPSRGVLEREVALTTGGAVHVRARDGHGVPLPRARIRRVGPLGDDDTETGIADENGELVVERLTPGTHAFTLLEGEREADGGMSILGLTFEAQDPAVRLAIVDGVRAELELALPLRGSLHGTVTLDGEALDRAELRVVAADAEPVVDAEALVGEAVGAMFGGLASAGSGGRARTESDGRYEIDGVPVGRRRVVVTHRSLAMPAHADVVIVEGDNVCDIAIRATTLRGTVLDENGRPIEGALVSALPETADAEANAAGMDEAAAILGGLFGGGDSTSGVRSDAAGRFELRGLREGVRLRVRATARLHVAGGVSTEALPPAGVREGLEIRLTAAGRVSVTSRIEGALTVQASWAGGEPAPPGAAGERDALLKSGRALVDGLPPGRWRFVLDGASGVAATALEQFVEVRAGETARIEF